MNKLDQFEAMERAATAGPWNWNLSLKSKQCHLEGSPRKGNETVMAFARWGMGGAQPLFCKGGILEDVARFAKVVPGREHHASWFQDIDHPDAALIAAARNLAPAFLSLARTAQRVLAAREAIQTSTETREWLEPLLALAKEHDAAMDAMRAALAPLVAEVAS